MEVAVKSVHIGEAIEKRRLELDISKSELGRRIGVSQQHVNRILKRDTMETSGKGGMLQASGEGRIQDRRPSYAAEDHPGLL